MAKIMLFSKESSIHEKKIFVHQMFLSSLPNNKFLDWSKLKAFADNKINVTEELKFVLVRVENIVGKGENAVFWHFLLFPKCFPKAYRVVLSRDCVVKS